MNVSSVPASPQVTAADTRKTKEKDTDAVSFASSSTVTPDNATPSKESAGEGVKPTTTPAVESKTAKERALAGLDKNNFETEVHQVMGTLNNWWGGVKKQVS
jgi:hypothetical protein